MVLQIAVSLTATAVIAHLALALTGRRWVALFAGLAHGTATGFTLDQCILTDSLNASLLIIAAARIGLDMLAGRYPSDRNRVFRAWIGQGCRRAQDDGD